MRRQVTDFKYAPTSVDLARPRPANAAAYQEHYGCPVHFGSRRNILASALTWLDHPLPMANAMAYRLSRQMLVRELERADIPSALGLAVQRAILRALPLAVAPADMARSLNLGERSLRRKLAQEGLGFRALLDEARKARAKELMAGNGQSLIDIAMQTGFSDVRAYSRAFKRWTGKSPSAIHSAVQPLGGAANEGWR
jgi:AraC-like DNA-binding protein